MKKKTLLSSILTIALCLSLIAGSTFALFTSESKVNVAVTAGKVDVVATVENLKLGTTLEKGNLKETSATTENNIITLDKIVPGDYVTFDIRIHNNSDVAVQYRTIIEKVEDKGLWDGLVVTFDEVKYEGKNAVKSEWATMNPGSEDIIVSVKVALPENAGNEYQEKSCKFAYTVEAVQGNAEVTSEWDGVTKTAPQQDASGAYQINTAAEFAYVMEHAQNKMDGYSLNPYTNGTYELKNNIDFSGYEVPGFGNSSAEFSGTFNGNGHTVSNFTIDRADEEDYAGLFNYAKSATISGLTVANATIIGQSKVGVLAGFLETGAITNCTVENCIVIANRKVGGAVGMSQGSTITNVAVKNSTIYCAGTADVGKVYGIENVAGTISGNIAGDDVVVLTGVSMTAVSNAADLATALTNGGNVLLLNDLTLSNWNTVKISNKNLTLYGNNKTITGLTKPLINFYGGNCTINDLTVENSIVVANGNDSTDNLGVGIILEEAQWANLYMNNCHVKNSSVNVGGTNERAGALVGYWIGGGEIKNCSVVDSTVYGTESAGGIVGHRQGQSGYELTAKVTGCTVSSTNVTSGNYAGAILGRLSTEAFKITGCTYTGNAYGNIWDGGNGTVTIN